MINLSFPNNLPVSLRCSEIAAAIQASQVVIVCGETGSGKTTQLPKICLSIGRGRGVGGAGLIGHTQPRRLAATSTAKRIAQELASPLGEHVGFKIRFQDTLSDSASIKLMTDGILLAETQADPLLLAYDTLIIDEAHERSLNIDFLLGYIKQLLPRRPDLKIIVTSATIDAERFAQHFSLNNQAAPIIEVSGRLYPVDIRYRPILDQQQSDTVEKSDAKNNERDMYEAIVDAVAELCQLSTYGDVLVFLPGEREIREAAQMLRANHPAHTEILPLFARLSIAEQEKIFRSGGGRRIVLATNVAETSLTVPGIRYVVDSGLARVKRYSYRNKVEQLQVEPIAQSSANQRAGRCGRIAHGVCIRLYAEQDFLSRPRFSDPEIFRSSLASVILRMRALNLGAVENFPFLDVPRNKAIQDGYQLLQELGAMDETQQLTTIGTQLAKLPLDPRIGRILLAANTHHCLREAMIIASALAIQDPRDRPLEQQAAADHAHKKFADEKSEFLSFLKIWQWFSLAENKKKSQKELRDVCREHFLSYPRLREWRDVHEQLEKMIAAQKWKVNASAATYEQLHLSLLTGLLGNIGCKVEAEAHYLGARGIKFFLWPGSHLSKKAGRWVIAAELVETSRLFARTLARIEPEWIEKIGRHLIRTSHSDPHWEKKMGQVLAYERGTIYGLTVYQGRRIDFSKLDSVEARSLLIRRALVEGEIASEMEKQLAFFVHNKKLIAEIENLEHRARRQDVLIDDELIYAFYEQHLPAHITSATALLHWYQEEKIKQPQILYLKREDLMRHEAAGITTALFPKAITIAGVEMTLTYHFEPGSPRDGVTLTVPLYMLNQVPSDRGAWLVPGMLKEKVVVLLKSLPQKLRRHCVPLPDYAAAFCERVIFAKGELLEAVIADLREHAHLTTLQRHDFKLENLVAHHSMNFKIIDDNGRQLEMGRNLAALQAALGNQAQQNFRHIVLEKSSHQHLSSTSKNLAKVPAHSHDEKKFVAQPTNQRTIFYGQAITSWSFEDLPELLEIQRGNETLFGYPALTDKLTHCEIEVFDTPQEAQRTHYIGMRRLFSLQLREQLKFLEKNIPGLQQMAMHYLSLGTQETLREQIIQVALTQACMQEPLPHNAMSFSQRKEDGRARLNLLAQELARLTLIILTEYASLGKKLQQAKSAPAAHADMQAQLQALINPHFLVNTPSHQLRHLPRYLKGIALRIDKLRVDPARDTARLAEFVPLYRDWQRTNNQRASTIDPRLEEFRWLLEELRIALFAQELRTPTPISIKRAEKVWQHLKTQ